MWATASPHRRQIRPHHRIGVEVILRCELIERAAGEAGIDSGARGEVPAGRFDLLLAQKVPTEVDANDPAVLAEGPDHVIGHVAGDIGQRAAAGM